MKLYLTRQGEILAHVDEFAGASSVTQDSILPAIGRGLFADAALGQSSAPQDKGTSTLTHRPKRNGRK